MKKQKLIFLLLGVLMALPVVARDFEYEYEGKTITYTVIDEAAKTCKTKAGSSAAPGNSVEGSLKLPANPLDGTTEYTLIEIGDYSFMKCSGLSSISIPNSVTTIGVEAFRSCTGLTSVVVPPSVTNLDEDAFWLCTGLEKSAYPEHLYNPFESGIAIRYPTEATITADGFVYSSDMTVIYFAPLRLSGEFIIPSTVTTVAQMALLDCNALTKIVIPPSVTTIERQAFKGCGYLSEVTFEDCNDALNLSSEAFTDSYISKLYMGRDWIVSGEESPFSGKISSVTMSNTISVIPDYAFSNCSDLTSVIIPNSVETIGEYAFSGCSGLTGELIIPNSVTSIGQYSFYNCSGLTLAVIGNSVQTIGSQAFSGCGGLTSVSIGNSVTYIGEYAFSDCLSLTSVTIPSSVTEIWNTLFSGCNNLISMKMLCNIPPKIKGWHSANQTAQIYLPNTTLEVPITDIVALAEYFGWWHFKSIIADGNPTKPYSAGGLTYCLIENPDNREAVILGHESSSVINIPERITDLSDSDNPVRYYVAGIAPEAFRDDNQIQTVTFDSRIKIVNIPSMTFYNCSSLTSITIPNSVETIGSDAFAGCKCLTSLVIGNSVETIGASAFSGCTGLTGELIIPNSVTSIGSGAFGDCSGLTSVTIGDSVQTIGVSGFWGCDNLTSVVIGSSVKTIGDNAFYGCGSIKELVIKDGEGTLNWEGWHNPFTFESLYLGRNLSGMFQKGNNLKSLTISSTSISDNAFRYCSSLTSLVIGNSVETIGTGAFAGCSGLTDELIIPNSVTSIGGEAFSGCSGLTSLVIGNSVETIGNYAFQNCYALSSVEIPNSVTTIGNEAFRDCNGLTSIVIGNTVETIGDYAFDGCYSLNNIYLLNPEAPTAADMTFTSGQATLYVPKGSVEKYAVAVGWTQFSDIRELDSLLKLRISEQNVRIEIGETAGLTVTAESSVPSSLEPLIVADTERWTSDNEAVATVDGGVVKAIGSGTATITYSVDDRFGYTHSVECEVSVNGNTTGIDEMTGGIGAIDYDEPYEVYDLSGVKVGDSVDGLVKGLYIVRQGDKVSKIAR